MGITNNNLLLFFNNNLNSLYVLNRFYEMTEHIYSFFKQFKSINDYDDYIRTFPMYNVKSFNPITTLKIDKTKSFSTLKIKTCVSSNFDVITNNLVKNVLPIKSETDNYLNNRELINFTVALQNVILNDDIINKNLLELSGAKIKTDYDYLFYILNDSNIPDYDNSKNTNIMEYSLMYYIVLNLFVNNNSRFYINLANLIYNEDILNNTLLKTEFNTFTNSLINDDTFLFNLSDFIGRKVFNIFQPSETFLDDMKYFTRETILSHVSNVFDEYLNTIDIQKRFTTLYLKYFRNSLAYSIYKKQIKDNHIFDYFNNSYDINRSNELNFYFSDESINQLISEHMTVNNLKQYLMPIYLYKNEVYKFLNSISRFTQLYSDEKLLTYSNYLVDSFLRSNTNNTIDNILSNIDSIKLYDYYSGLDYKNIIEEDQSSVFISFIFMNDILKMFLNSDLFTDFLIDKLKEINTYLYQNKWINYDYNWYQNIDLIRHYLMSYFLSNLCQPIDDRYQNNIFPIFTDTLNSNILSVLDSEDFFYHTSENIDQYINQLKNNKTLKTNIYNINTRILDASIKKQVYFKILSSFIE